MLMYVSESVLTLESMFSPNTMFLFHTACLLLSKIIILIYTICNKSKKKKEQRGEGFVDMVYERSYQNKLETL